MADQYTKTQLAKIVAPNLNDPSNYAGDLQKAFSAINENFKKIATMPFVQGVQGDSYKLDIREIFEIKDDDKYLTEDGATLFNSMFDTDLFSDGMPLSTCINMCGEGEGHLNLNINNVSPLDGFRDGNEINELYFYSVINDEGVATNSYLGQLYYFVDSRLLKLGDVFTSNPYDLINFVDYSGFYRYEPISETTGKYVKTEILPTIYYDPERNDICWKLNGQETGISAVGAKGKDGTDSSLTFVKVNPINDTTLSTYNSKVVAIFDYGKYNESIEDYQWDTDVAHIKAIDDGVVLICITTGDNVDIRFAFGVVRTDGAGDKIAYWNDETVLDNFLADNKVTDYFKRIGYESNVSSAAWLAIPAYLYRTIGSDAFHTVSKSFNGTRGDKQDLLLRRVRLDGSNFYRVNRNDQDGDYNKWKNIRLDNYDLVVQEFEKNDPIISDRPVGNLTNGYAKLYSGGLVVSSGNDANTLPEALNDNNPYTHIKPSEAHFGGTVKINGTLTVDGSSTIKGSQTVNGGATINGGQTVNGNLTLNGNMNVKSDKQIIGGGNPTGHGHFWRGKENAFILHDGYNSDDMFYPVVTVKATNNGAYYSMGTYEDNFILEYIPKEVHEGTKTDAQKNNLIKSITFDHDATGINVYVSGKATINNGVTINRGATINNGDLSVSGDISSGIRRKMFTGNLKFSLGSWGDLTTQKDISSDSHPTVTWSELINSPGSKKWVGNKLIKLKAKAQSGTSERYTINISNCPGCTLFNLGVQVENYGSSYELNNVEVVVGSRTVYTFTVSKNNTKSVEMLICTDSGGNGFICGNN